MLGGKALVNESNIFKMEYRMKKSFGDILFSLVTFSILLYIVFLSPSHFFSFLITIKHFDTVNGKIYYCSWSNGHDK